MFQSPGAILAKFGPFTLRWYGVMIALGFVLAVFFAQRMARRWGIDHDKAINCALMAFIGGIAGARLYWVALNWDHFQHHPLEIFQTWMGGLSIHGGIIGGLLAAVWYCRQAKLPLLTCFDIGGACLPLGQAIGRWGNFFNSEAFGKPVPDTFPLRLYISPENRPIDYQGADYFHPTFLYESIWNLLVFFLLYLGLADKLRPYPGVLFLLYIGMYSIGRLLIEPLRVDSIMINQLPVPMVASAVCFVAAVAGIMFLFLRYKGRAQTR